MMGRGRKRGFTRGAARGPRRKTTWEDTIFADSIASGAQADASLLDNILTVDQGLTLVRTIIDLTIVPSASPTGFGAQAVDFAIGLTSQEAFAAGVLPDPNAEAEQPVTPWVYRTRVGIVQDLDVPRPVRIQADIRGQRLIHGGELFWIIDNNILLGTAFSIHVAGLIRTLFKLP